MIEVLLAEYGDAGAGLERKMLAEAGMAASSAPCRTPEEIIEAGRNAGAFVVLTTPVTRAVFEALPNLRLISIPGVGADIIDLDAARDHGVWVANVPHANVTEVATHALAMTLAMIRHLPFFDRDVRAGRWDYEATGRLRRPGKLTLGIAGLGRIGRALAGLAAPCFGRIIGYDPYIPGEAWPDGVARTGDLAGLFRQSDVVSLHMPLTGETQGLVTARLLAGMPPGGYLVNVSRGGLVDVDALLAALDSGHLAGAALDVLPQEPPPPDHPALRHPKLLLSPHAAFYSTESDEEMRRESIRNIIDWARNGRPNFVVVEPACVT